MDAPEPSYNQVSGEPRVSKDTPNNIVPAKIH